VLLLFLFLFVVFFRNTFKGVTKKTFHFQPAALLTFPYLLRSGRGARGKEKGCTKKKKGKGTTTRNWVLLHPSKGCLCYRFCRQEVLRYVQKKVALC